MDNTQRPLTIQEKLELIRSRAVQLGLRRHDLEDAIQDAMLELLEFSPDPDKTNGASESTILTKVIDRRLFWRNSCWAWHVPPVRMGEVEDAVVPKV